LRQPGGKDEHPDADHHAQDERDVDRDTGVPEPFHRRLTSLML